MLMALRSVTFVCMQIVCYGGVRKKNTVWENSCTEKQAFQ